MAKRIDDPEVERGRKIIAQMEKLERKKRVPHYGGAMILILALVLISAIVLVILSNRERFALIWGHLTQPDSIPGETR
jgi:hypothetical protein